MNLSLAELKRLLIGNPDLAAENTQALKSLQNVTGSPRTHETMEGQVIALNAREDCADMLLGYIKMLASDLPQPIRDYSLDRYRIDLAWPSAMLAVEVDGGQWAAGGGKHGSRSDYAKTRRLTTAGWRLLRFTAGEVRDNPVGVIDEIRQALG